MNNNYVLETKMYNLSTRSSCCRILNENTDYKSKLEYHIPNMVSFDESVEYIQFSIPTAIIPCSFYIVNDTNCRLDILINGANSSYNFPYGNYTASYFITQFTIVLGSEWTLTLNNFNSTFTVSNAVQDFTILSTSTISSIMGFSNDVVSSSFSATLPRCCNFLPLPRINLRCAELANTNTVGNNPSSDVITTIINNTRPNGQIYYTNQSQSKLLFRHHNLNRFVVLFTDDDGNPINFNGISSFFTLQFDIYRKHTEKPKRFSDIIEFVNNRKQVIYQEEDMVEENI